jgi:hypothetical protein
MRMLAALQTSSGTPSIALRRTIVLQAVDVVASSTGETALQRVVRTFATGTAETVTSAVALAAGGQFRYLQSSGAADSATSAVAVVNGRQLQASAAAASNTGSLVILLFHAIVQVHLQHRSQGVCVEDRSTLLVVAGLRGVGTLADRDFGMTVQQRTTNLTL